MTSRKAQRPKPPWLFTAGTQRSRAVSTLASLSFFFAGDFEDEVEQVIRAVAVVEPDDEVGHVLALVVLERVGIVKPRLWFLT